MCVARWKRSPSAELHQKTIPAVVRGKSYVRAKQFTGVEEATGDIKLIAVINHKCRGIGTPPEIRFRIFGTGEETGVILSSNGKPISGSPSGDADAAGFDGAGGQSVRENELSLATIGSDKDAVAIKFIGFQ